MKFFYTLLLVAATAMAAQDNEDDHLPCSLVGERCNLSVHPPIECCPFMECVHPEDPMPGQDGWCRKT